MLEMMFKNKKPKLAQQPISLEDGYLFYTDFSNGLDTPNGIRNLVTGTEVQSNVIRTTRMTVVDGKQVGEFNGSNGVLFTVPAQIGTGDFTLEIVVLSEVAVASNAAYTYLSNYSSNTGSGSSSSIGISQNDDGLYSTTAAAVNRFTNTKIPLNKWSSVVLQRKDGVVRYYLDGIVINEFAYTANITRTGFGLGRYAGGTANQRHAKCLMSEALIANKCRYNFDGFVPDVTGIIKSNI